MDILAPVRSFDRFQQRHAALGFPIAVLKKFSDDGAGDGAALIAYYGFFSLFPLLLVFTTVLGFVLHGDPHAQQKILDSALKQFPVVGSQLGGKHSLKGSGIGLAVGLVGTILSGLGVTLAAQKAFNQVYAVPRKERPDFLFSRLRGLGMLFLLGLLQVISTVASGLAGGGYGGVGTFIVGILVSLFVNFVLFFAAFRILVDNAVPLRELLPGIGSATVLWTVVQTVGGAYIGHVVKGAGSTYGTFATVIGLLTWLFLGARVVVYSAEVNTVLTRRLWPRSIVDPPVPADRKVKEGLAKIEERDDKQTVEADFHNPKDAKPKTELEHEEHAYREKDDLSRERE